jgi:hypothetical protein
LIKIFGQIRQNLLSKGKIGEYLKYAVGEIILVVIGILIALQINNWNENFKLKDEENRILKQLNAEFKTNKKLLEVLNAKNKEVLNNLNKILALIPINPESVDLDSLSHYIIKTFDFNTFDPIQGTISELNNSSFKVITNDTLRNLLLSWNTVREDFRDDELFAIDYSKDYYLPKMSEKVSLDFGLRKKSTDLSFLQSIEFENLIRIRQVYYKDVVNTVDLVKLESTIDKIIKLSCQTE